MYLNNLQLPEGLVAELLEENTAIRIEEQKDVHVVGARNPESIQAFFADGVEPPRVGFIRVPPRSGTTIHIDRYTVVKDGVEEKHFRRCAINLPLTHQDNWVEFYDKHSLLDRIHYSGPILINTTKRHRGVNDTDTLRVIVTIGFFKTRFETVKRLYHEGKLFKTRGAA